jgi:hypothetical protein
MDADLQALSLSDLLALITPDASARQLGAILREAERRRLGREARQRIRLVLRPLLTTDPTDQAPPLEFRDVKLGPHL